MIRFDNVNFSYGKKEILKGFNFEIEDGARICLFGASGVGKTTVLRLIMGLEKPKSGEITGIKDKKISAVFQEDRLITQKNVYQNLKLFGGEKKIEEILNNLGLSGAENLYPDQLSGGMARRIAIARALNFGGEIYIFDEPFNGIDKENIEKTADYILKETKGKTFITVTHSLYEAELLDAKIIYI